MSITILGEGDTLRLLQSDAPIPEGDIRFFLYKRRNESANPRWIDLQMPSFVWDNEEELF